MTAPVNRRSPREGAAAPRTGGTRGLPTACWRVRTHRGGTPSRMAKGRVAATRGGPKRPQATAGEHPILGRTVKPHDREGFGQDSKTTCVSASCPTAGQRLTLATDRAGPSGGWVPGWTPKPGRTSSMPPWPTGASWRSDCTRVSAPRTQGVGAAFLADAVDAASQASLADHLDATISPTRVDMRVASNPCRDGIWVCPDDVALARLLSEVAQRHEVTSVPDEVTQVELALDTPTTGGSARSGPRCSPAHRMPWCTTPCSPPPASCRRCGSKAPSPTRCPGSAGISTCGWPRRSQRCASLPPSRPAATRCECARSATGPERD